MSRSYSKSFGRKVGTNAQQQASIQFDKLFCENSNRPSAAKSAGTVGKWGITSFTSIRSSNFCISNRRDDTYGSKRKLNNDLKLNRNKDLFTFECASQSPAAIPPRPKKFFKSRNPLEPAYPTQAAEPARKYTKAPAKQPLQQRIPPVTAASKKAFPVTRNNDLCEEDEEDQEQTEAMNLSSSAPTLPPAPPVPVHQNPPIVLRIFKGTSQLITSDNLTQPPAPPPAPAPVSSAPVTRSSRRRHNHIDTSGYTSPKRLRDRGRDVNQENYSGEFQVEIKTDISSSRSKPVTGVVKPSIIEEQESKVSMEMNIEVEKEEKEEKQKEIQERGDVKLEPHKEIENQLVAESEPMEVVEQATSEDKSQQDSFDNSEKVSNNNNNNINKECISEVDENTKRLEEAEQLLSSTYIDFGAATNKLLDIRTTSSSSNSTVTDKDREKLIKVLSGDCDDDDDDDEEDDDDDDEEDDDDENNDIENTNGIGEIVINNKINDKVSDQSEKRQVEGFSDSDDSDSIADQISLLAEVENESTSITIKEEEGQQQSNVQEPLRKTLPAKKGSIFKSRGVTGGNKKRLALYKHKWCDDKEAGNQGGNTPVQNEQSLNMPNTGDTLMEDDVLTRVTMYPEGDIDNEDSLEGITSVKCNKEAKKFYTVVRNVKKAHQIQESGEFQEFNDDVEYILDALQDNNPIGTRCLSAITLASKCMAPAFRMHVRAHGTVARFFRALHDAAKDQSLGMCTATVMFVLSQDRLNMDLDRDCLELMLNLLESDTSHTNALDDCGLSDAQLHKTRARVRQLCAEIQGQGHAKHLNLDNITVGHLAMETLLSLTSRRAGEWFKEELRELGGLEHIIKTVVECSRLIDFSILVWTPPILDRLRKVDRCLRVLENVSLQNEENTVYLLTYGDEVLVNTLVRVFIVCDHEMSRFPVYNIADKESTGFVIRECLLANIKVMINLTHDFNQKSFGSSLTGGQDGLLNSTLHVLLYGPEYVPEEQKFDLIVLTLTLLINLVEHSDSNRKLLVEAKAPTDANSIFEGYDTAVKSLVSLFYQHEELARTEEKKTDAILDGEKPASESTAPPKSQEEHIEETVAMLLQKAGRNMEHTLIAAYVVLLLGYLTIENKDYETIVRGYLPEGNFATMLSVLEKFFKFMTLTAAAGSGISRGIKAAEMVIKHLTESDKLIQPQIQPKIEDE
ncbi:cohesin release factor wings apart-like [Lycorma delicatula]|uniref:cohesin release factor wings apart-like n=1 Tax=Lycorma delicatula TaxID=130591 RepID=UPI003F513190